MINYWREVFLWELIKWPNKANKIVEIKAYVPESTFFAKNQSDSFESSLRTKQ